MEPVDDRGREVSRLFEGRYEVLGLLGRGGFAAVYQIRNLRLRRLEALKVVAGSHEQNEEFIQRFEQESRVAASLEHPNILKVYDFGHDGGVLWYSMPFIDGPTLTAELRRRARSTRSPRRASRRRSSTRSNTATGGVIHRASSSTTSSSTGATVRTSWTSGSRRRTTASSRRRRASCSARPRTSRRSSSAASADGRTDVYALGVSLFR